MNYNLKEEGNWAFFKRVELIWIENNFRNKREEKKVINK